MKINHKLLKQQNSNKTVYTNQHQYKNNNSELKLDGIN